MTKIEAQASIGTLDVRPRRQDPSRLTGSLTIAKSAFWNIAGRAGPMVVAVIATPFLVADLGPTRWGLFALALSLIGIFGIFDFGIGRALTKLLAERIALGELAGGLDVPDVLLEAALPGALGEDGSDDAGGGGRVAEFRLDFKP